MAGSPINLGDEMKKSLQNQYIEERRGNAIATAFVILLIGLCLGMTIVVLARHHDANRHVKPLAVLNKCRTCHPSDIPKIVGYCQYKRHHQKPTTEDRRLAKEMADNELVVMQYLSDKKF